MNQSYYIGIFLMLGLLVSGAVAIIVGMSTSIGLGLGLLGVLDIALIAAAYYLIKHK